MSDQGVASLPATALEVRARVARALRLDLVGPAAGDALSEERLPGWVRPSNWYLTGFLIPSGTPAEKSADADEDDDLGEIPESAGPAEESNEERKAAKKGFFPSSMGLSFLVPEEARALTVIARWGDYAPTEIMGADDKPVSVWQRHRREVTVSLVLTGASRDPVMRDVPGSNGLQLHVVERSISAADLAEHIPQGTGIRVPREPPCAGQGRARSRLRLPVRDRGPERPPLRPATGPARCAGCGVGRAGG